jgi:lipopolysaccharide export system protein LptC
MSGLRSLRLAPTRARFAGPRGPGMRPHRVRRAGGDPYSRRVARLKLLLPATGLALLLLVAAWPRLATLFERARIGFAAIDLREARELKMVDPRYAGIDRQDRPYVLSAAIGRQVPDRTDLVSLAGPRARMALRHGAVTVTAASGIYQSQAKLLDLFRRVRIVRQDGTRFLTDSARVDFSDNSARGRDPVRGRGPWGTVTAQGFRILDKGTEVIFTGRADLVLRGAAGRSRPAPPPALPPAIAARARAIAAAARTSAPVRRHPAAAKRRPAAPERKAGRHAG